MTSVHRGTPEKQIERARGLLSHGLLQEAEVVTLQALREDDEHLNGYRLLADIEERLGRPDRVVRALERAASLDPDDAALWCRLGSVRALRARWPEAVEDYTRAFRLAPDDPIPLASLAGAQLAAHQIEAASATGQLLLERFPQTADAHLLHGHICKVLGQFDRAACAYERALEIAPQCSSAAYSLIELRVPAHDDPRTLDIECRVQRGDLTDSDRANFEFSLARIYESAQQYERSFAHYVNANGATWRALKARGLDYDAAGCARDTELIMQRYPPDRLQPPIEALPIRLRPIFIVGMPRSGTTLVEQILASHTRVSSGGELTAAPRCYELYLQRRRERQMDGPASASPGAEASLLMEMRERYVEDLFECGLDTEFVIDKLPGNFQLLGFIRSMFPDASIVHCQRAPIATCWSLFTSNFAADAPYRTSLQNLAHYYRLYQLLMSHWRTVLHPSMIEVQYEGLVAHPEDVVKTLLSACGLDWEDRCLRFHQNAQPVTTASVVQARQPLFSSSLQRWKPFEAHLGALRALD